MFQKKTILFFPVLFMFFAPVDFSFKNPQAYNLGRDKKESLSSNRGFVFQFINSSYASINPGNAYKDTGQNTATPNNVSINSAQPILCGNIPAYEANKSLSNIKDTISNLSPYVNQLTEDLRSKKTAIDAHTSSSTTPRSDLNSQKTEIEKELKLCRGYLTDYQKASNQISKCNEEQKQVKSASKDFATDCAAFAGGHFRCFKAIQACAVCPTDEDYEDYDCVNIHQKTECPARAGETLKTSKENREKFTEEVKELQDEIRDQETDLVETENDLEELLSELESEFIESVRKLERKTEERKADLENQLAQQKAQTSEAISKALAAIQAEIDNGLKMVYSIQNAIIKANRQYRKEQRQIVMECEVQARGRLAKYRQKRRAAIQTGSLQIPISSLLKKGRTNFKTKDQALLTKYHNQCLAKRKPDFQAVETDYKDRLRMIEQQKTLYQNNIQKKQQQMLILQGQAGKAQNKAVQNYAAKMAENLEVHQKEFMSAYQSYRKAKNSLLSQSKKIVVGQQQLSRSKQMLREKQMSLIREQEMSSYLKSKNVKEDSEDEFSKASGSFATYKDAYDSAFSSCGCDDKDDEQTSIKSCKKLTGQFKKNLSDGGSSDAEDLIEDWFDEHIAPGQR